MNLFDYNILKGTSITNELNEYLKLTPEQKTKIWNDNYRLPFDILVRKKTKPTKWYWRLTTPLFFIFFMALIIGMLFNYIFSGEHQYSYTSKMCKVYNWWLMKL